MQAFASQTPRARGQFFLFSFLPEKGWTGGGGLGGVRVRARDCRTFSEAAPKMREGGEGREEKGCVWLLAVVVVIITSNKRAIVPLKSRRVRCFPKVAAIAAAICISLVCRKFVLCGRSVRHASHCLHALCRVTPSDLSALSSRTNTRVCT